jgi:hypothetical protein
MSRTPSWTTPDDLVATLRRRWASGRYLRAYARGTPWETVSLPIRGPTADDVLQDSAAVVAWTDTVRRAAIDRRGRTRFTIECRAVRNRVLGENLVPTRIHISSLEQLAELLGVVHEIERLDSVLAATRRVLPGAEGWVADHPSEALSHSDAWPRLLATARWIVDHDASTLDLRHLDVPDVDTKFVESNRKIIGRLLDEVLPINRIDPTANDFALRYGFRPRPRYVRIRLLSPVSALPPHVTEIELRADELAALPLPVTTVFVVENQASYLSFPELPDAIVVFGGGFAVTTLELLPWLAEKEVVYWGDIDTHGFAILDRLRERVPGACSILMDTSTLLAHRDQLTNEPSPTSAILHHLTTEESDLYRDLIEDRYGSSVRLEQERIRFGLLRDALTRWQKGSGSR